MKFFLRFMMWATIAFVACWFAHPAWQRVIGAAGARMAAPGGSTIEITDLELFFPFDVGVFVALCLASTWNPVARRLRALAIGTPLLVLVEILAVAASFRIMIASSDPEAAWRAVDGVIRFVGLVTAAAVWLALLGGDQLSLASRRWLAD